MNDFITVQSRCQAVKGVYAGFDGDKVFSGPLRCKSWSCPICGPKKIKQLRKRALNGGIALGAVPKYGIKFATLTFGGKEKRSAYIVRDENGMEQMAPGTNGMKPLYDCEAIYNDMMESFNRLRTALVKHFGKFMYFRVFELHQDGVPHLHVLFAGKNVIPKSFYEVMQRLWNKYGMGFCKLNVIRDRHGRVITRFNDAQHAVNYLMKYMSKPGQIRTAGKYKRVFSSSRGALMPIKKKEWERMQVVYGSFDDNGDCQETVIADYEHVEDLHRVTVFDVDGFGFKYPDMVGTIINRHLQNAMKKGETEKC
jgi:hypothetical protein